MCERESAIAFFFPDTCLKYTENWFWAAIKNRYHRSATRAKYNNRSLDKSDDFTHVTDYAV